MVQLFGQQVEFADLRDLRQALVTIGLSIIGADLLLARYGGLSYQFEVPAVLYGSLPLPIIGGYSGG